MSDNAKATTSLIQLKNEFFYVFGIVPLEAYNVIGDGITDNRQAIQRAINEAIKNNVKYIFVNKGIYFYLGELKNTDSVVFIGNSIDTRIRSIEIKQFPELWKEALGIGASILPIGSIIQSMSINEPINHLLCDGRTVEIEKYPLLYPEIVSEENRIEGATTFVLPTFDNSKVKHYIRYR